MKFDSKMKIPHFILSLLDKEHENFLVDWLRDVDFYHPKGNPIPHLSLPT